MLDTMDFTGLRQLASLLCFLEHIFEVFFLSEFNRSTQQTNFRVVTKISSCRVNTTSKRGI